MAEGDPCLYPPCSVVFVETVPISTQAALYLLKSNMSLFKSTVGCPPRGDSCEHWVCSLPLPTSIHSCERARVPFASTFSHWCFIFPCREPFSKHTLSVVPDGHRCHPDH